MSENLKPSIISDGAIYKLLSVERISSPTAVPIYEGLFLIYTNNIDVSTLSCWLFSEAL